MNEFLKSNGFTLAAVTQLVGILVVIVTLVAFFTTLRGDVTHLKEEVNKKAVSVNVDAQFSTIAGLVDINSKMINSLDSKIVDMKVGIDNLHIDLEKHLSKSP